MSTIDERPGAAISSEAFKLLDCFVAGLDEIVYEMAEDAARARQGIKGDKPVTIETTDIRVAAEFVLGHLKQSVKTNEVSGDIQPFIDQIESCFKQRTNG